MLEALLFAPAGQYLTDEDQIDRDRLDRVVDGLQREGFLLRALPSASASHLRFAGDDDLRRQDFLSVLRDESADLAVALRGGFGSQCLLNDIPWEALPAKGALLTGYSDVTVLLNALWTHTGRIALHGPVGGDFDETKEWQKPPFASLRRAVQTFGPKAETTRWDFAFTPECAYLAGLTSDPFCDAVKNSLTTNGTLWGGNLTMLTTLAGTPHAPSERLNGRSNFLFLEDIDEPAWRIERSLLHLSQAGMLEGTRAIFLGDFLGANRVRLRQGGYTLESALKRFSRVRSDIVLLTGLPIGHGSKRETIPVGVDVQVSMDAAQVHWEAKFL